MSAFRQIGSVTAMNLRSVPQRLGSSSVIVIGIAGVVAVIMSVFGLTRSLSDAVLGDGQRGPRNRVARRRDRRAVEHAARRCGRHDQGCARNRPRSGRPPGGFGGVRHGRQLAAQGERRARRPRRPRCRADRVGRPPGDQDRRRPPLPAGLAGDARRSQRSRGVPWRRDRRRGRIARQPLDRRRRVRERRRRQ